MAPQTLPQPNPVHVVCCICRCSISGDLAAAMVSHGICPECLPAYRVSCGLPARPVVLLGGAA
jgi:hypothetical protein